MPPGPLSSPPSPELSGGSRLRNRRFPCFSLVSFTSMELKAIVQLWKNAAIRSFQHVPEDVHRLVKAEAAARGLSMPYVYRALRSGVL